MVVCCNLVSGSLDIRAGLHTVVLCVWADRQTTTEDNLTTEEITTVSKL